MNWTKWIIGTLIGGVVYFFAGWAVYGVLLNEIYTGHELRATVTYAEADFKIGLMVISCFAMGGFLSFIFIRWANVRNFIEGASSGFIIAAFMAITVGFSLAAEYKIFGVELALYDVIASGICAALSGGAIGWYLSRGND